VQQLADLHCHSHCSDGKHTPAELCIKALESGVNILALTDHDTTAGLAQLHAAARGSSLQIINGVELSARWKLRDIHVLGLNIDPDCPDFKACIKAQIIRRITRAEAISERLHSLTGVQNAYQKALQYAGHEGVGRPHFAHVLVHEGVVTSAKQAFQKYLVRGRGAYVPVAWLSIEEAIAVIINAGGSAVLAHPLKYQLTRSKLHELIKAFKAWGGVGLEVVSGATSVMDMNEMAGVCLRYELFASTGSDYHGEGLSSIDLGRQMLLPAGCIPIWQQWG